MYGINGWSWLPNLLGGRRPGNSRILDAVTPMTVLTLRGYEGYGQTILIGQK